MLYAIVSVHGFHQEEGLVSKKLQSILGSMKHQRGYVPLNKEVSYVSKVHAKESSRSSQNTASRNDVCRLLRTSNTYLWNDTHGLSQR